MFVFRNDNGKIVGFSRFRINDDQDLIHENSSEFIEYLNNVDAESTNEEIYNNTLKNSKLLKAVVLTLNDKSAFSSTDDILPLDTLKELIKSNM